MLIGYARTSTVEQTAGLEAQQRDLLATGCTKLFVEQASSVAIRAELTAALEFSREGDALVVTRLDRLARSTADLLHIIQDLERKGVALRVLDFGGSAIDTMSPSGRLMLTMFGALAQFERDLMLQRQREGIAKAKVEGRYRGRKPTAQAKAGEIIRLKIEGISALQIAAKVRVSRASIYRIIAAAGLGDRGNNVRAV